MTDKVELESEYYKLDELNSWFAKIVGFVREFFTGKRPNDVFIERIAKTYNERVKSISKDAQPKATSLMTDILKQINYMHHYKLIHRSRYVRYQCSCIFTSLVATISIAITGVLDQGDNFLSYESDEWNIIAIIASALTTSIVLLAKIGNSRSLWIIGTQYLHLICKLAIELNEILLDLDEKKLKDSKEFREHLEKSGEPTPQNNELTEYSIEKISALRTRFNNTDNNFRNTMHQSNEENSPGFNDNNGE